MAPEGDLVALRLARGCRSFQVVVEDQVAAYGWLSTGPEWIGELGLEIRPGRHEAYVWNCVTLPERRRRGLFRALLLSSVERARREGMLRLRIGSVEESLGSALAMAGFAPVLVVRSRERFGVRWTAVSPVANADQALVLAAREAIGVGRNDLRRSSNRRH